MKSYTNAFLVPISVTSATLLLAASLGCRESSELIDSTFDGGGGKEIVQPVPLPLPTYCEGVIRPCYTGNTAELTHGECRPGILRCAGEGIECVGQTLPMDESCDGLDNDCDGQVDEGMSWNINVVAIIDNSCSMAGKIAGVHGALTGLIEDYKIHSGIRWAIIGAPPSHPRGNELPRREFNFENNPQGAINAVLRQDGHSGSGEEPVVDAISMVVHNAWPLAWTSDNRLLLVFTDEIPQVVYGSTPVRPDFKTLIFTEDANWTWFGDQFELSNSAEMRSKIEPHIKKGSCQ